MDTFLSVVAQISFTLAGLIIVAIAADSETRHYWIGHRPRRLFAYVSLLLVTLPGVVSIFGLIPQSTEDAIPSWIYSAFIIGILYLFLAIVASFRKKNSASAEELRELDKELFRPYRQLGVDSVLLILTALLAFFLHRELAQISLGLIFGLSIFSGISSVMDLLRLQELSEQEGISEPMGDANNTTDVSGEMEMYSRSTNSNVSEDRLDSERRNTNSLLISSMLAAIIAFLLGMLVGRGYKT
jgi:hypothetical protein